MGTMKLRSVISHNFALDPLVARTARLRLVLGEQETVRPKPEVAWSLPYIEKLLN